MRIQNTVFDVDFVASEVVFQPLHSINATSLHGEGVNAVRVSRCRLRMNSHSCDPRKSMKRLTLCESKADPRWKRTDQRKGGSPRISRAGIPKRPLPNC